jgi:hypothetical protein
VTVQRTIEMVGIPTVLVTVESAESAQARPPRALSPKGFSAGHSLGKPNDSAFQRRILMDALGLLAGPPLPGEVVERDFTLKE